MTALFGGLLVVGAAIGGAYLAFKGKPQPRLDDSLVEKGPDSPDKKRIVDKAPPDPVKEVSTKDKPKVDPVPPRGESLARRVLDVLNDQRKREHLDPVTLSDESSQECARHAAYLAKHAATVGDLDPHDEDTKRPGYSEGGRSAARAASVVYQEPLGVLKVWLSATAHRAFLLHPDLKTIGFASARTASKGWVSVFDWVRGRSAATAKRKPFDPVIYPGNAQRDVPLFFPGNEIPDPLPNTKDKLAGFPATVTFPGPDRIPDARATLEDESGNEVLIYFSSPTRPANERYTREQQNTICLFAREVLRPGMRYVVRVEARVGTKEWSRVWTFTTQSPAEQGRRIYTRALDRLNLIRKAAGLGSVTMDPETSIACLAHASYLARHLDRVEDLRLNDEQPELPGFTETGKAIAQKSAIRVGGGVGPFDAIDWLFGSVINRHLALNPSMKTIGFGAAQQAPRGWIWVISLSPVLKKDDFSGGILYPCKNQKDVPLYFGQELSSLVPAAEKNAVAGFAITANFFPLSRVSKSKATLTDGAGNEVECWISTPEKPLPGTGNYRQILLVPKKPLSSATTYTATMSAVVDKKEWAEKWSFTTVDSGHYRDEVAALLLRRLNKARREAGLSAVTLDSKLSPACQKHADYIVRHLEHPKVQGLGIHDEDLTLAGASREGAAAGQASVIALLPNPADSIAGWMTTLYHRIPLLDPRLKRVGYGQARHPTRGWITVLDSGHGK